MKPHTRLFFALLGGALLGALLYGHPELEWVAFLNSYILQPIGQIFLRLIFMVVVPMVFCALVLGTFELGRSRGIGQVASKTLMYTLMASSASVVIGITLVNLIRPGSGLTKGQLHTSNVIYEKIVDNASKAKPIHQVVVELVTKNPLESALRALDGEMLALMIFALLFGVGLVRATNQKDENILIQVLEQIFNASMSMIELAMKLAPLAVFSLVFGTAYTNGLTIFGSLGLYVGVVVLGLLIQQFVVYALCLKFVAKRSPWQFFSKCRDVYLYAFSTASSNATLPRALATAKDTLGLPAEISRFVLTIGATANQNGTALFEGVTVLFLAQVYGINLSIASQIQVVIMSVIAGIGTAGVPGGSLPLILILLQSVGIPPEGMALILGVDRFLDMCRTTLNVSGDLVIAAMVSPNESVRSPTIS